MTAPANLPANRLMRHRTPDQILGPYFPVRRNYLERCDLTSIEGADGIAQGEIIEVTGRILNRNGEPVSGAGVTIWQANTFGRYVHPDDANLAPLDPNFVGCADIRSGERWRLSNQNGETGCLSRRSGLESSASHSFRGSRAI